MKPNFDWTTKKEIKNVYIGSFFVWVFFAFFSFPFLVIVETTIKCLLSPPAWKIYLHQNPIAFQHFMHLLATLTEETVLQNLPTRLPIFLDLIITVATAACFTAIYGSLILLALRSKRRHEKKRGLPRTPMVSLWKVIQSFLRLVLYVLGLCILVSAGTFNPVTAIGVFIMIALLSFAGGIKFL